TNNMINDMGLNFMHRLQEETGASVSEVVNAYSVVKGIFGMESVWREIEKLDNKIDANMQLAMLDDMRRSLRRASRWYLRHGNKGLSIDDAIAFYLPTMQDLSKNLQDYLVETEYKELEEKCRVMTEAGV